MKDGKIIEEKVIFNSESSLWKFMIEQILKTMNNRIECSIFNKIGKETEGIFTLKEEEFSIKERTQVRKIYRLRLSYMPIVYPTREHVIFKEEYECDEKVYTDYSKTMVLKKLYYNIISYMLFAKDCEVKDDYNNTINIKTFQTLIQEGIKKQDNLS